MEIRIRTHDEFHRDHVTIEISGTHEEAVTVAERVAPGYWATAAEKAERQVRELEEKIQSEIEARDRAIAWAERMERERNTAQQAREIETKERLFVQEKAKELAADRDTFWEKLKTERDTVKALAEQVRLYDVDRKTERDRADRAQARVAELETSLARYVRAHVCTDRCTKDAHVAFEGNQLVKKLEQELAYEREQGGRIESELSGEVRRLKEELNGRFTVEQVADAKDGARADERARLDREVIKPLNTKLTRVHSAVLGTELARELGEYREASAATLMVEALSEVRRITGVTSV